jgi:N-acyl-D-amino-acid deacylase
MKVCGKKNWGLIDQMLGMLDRRRRGDSYLFDQYPYVAAAMLGVILPPWVHSGGYGQIT